MQWKRWTIIEETSQNRNHCTKEVVGWCGRWEVLKGMSVFVGGSECQGNRVGLTTVRILTFEVFQETEPVRTSRYNPYRTTISPLRVTLKPNLDIIKQL